MRVIICGAGQVGYGIAERLAGEHNDVTVIDNSPTLIAKIQDQLDVRGLVGHGSHPDVLAAAGAANADMIIAVTLYDEVNMMACQVAHSLFDVTTKIARVRAQSYRNEHWQDLFARENVPIDVVIFPELEVGELFLRRISLPGVRDVVDFADGAVSVVAIDCDEESPVVDTPLVQLSELFPDLGAVVAGVWRDGKLIIPHSNDFVQAGDLAYVVVDRKQILRTISIFGKEAPEPKNIVLAGGGNIGKYLAQSIEEHLPKSRLVVVENSKEKAESLANELDNGIVLHGNALEENILNEANVSGADLMLSVTNDDQVNILSALMAKRMGCSRCVTLLNNAGYHRVTDSLGIDDYVNPRSVTLSRILQHIRRGRIRSVYSVQNGEAEVVEGEVMETSPLAGKPLRELRLPDGGAYWCHLPRW